MADGTKNEWTDATMVDRDGRRVRRYQRADPTRPGQQLRREMAARGRRWCRECAAWLAAEDVSANGLCRPHGNADAAARYARPGNYRDRRQQRSARRARDVDAMPPEAATLLTELFGGQCAYCPAPATCWDHAEPVTRGGATVPGNMLPACKPCNSAKRDLPLDDWLDRAPAVSAQAIDYLSHKGVI